MADLSTLGAAISSYNQATGSHIDPSQPWNTPGWDTPSQNGSLHALFNSWASQQNGGQIPDYGQSPNAQSALQNFTANPTPAADIPTTPTDTTPGSVTTAQQLQNLFQPTYMQTPTSGSATQYTGSVDPSATIQQIYANLDPQFSQATRNLNNQLAAAGIEGGGAIDAQQQLQSAETGTLGSALQQAIQSAQGLNQQAGLANTSAQNQFNQQNLQNLYNTNAYNTQVANGGQQQYANALLGQYNTDSQNFNQLNNAQFGNQTNLGYQQNAQNSTLNQNLAGNYQVQQGAGQGAAQIGTQLGQYFGQQQPYRTTPTQPTTQAQPYQVS